MERTLYVALYPIHVSHIFFMASPLDGLVAVVVISTVYYARKRESRAKIGCVCVLNGKHRQQRKEPYSRAKYSFHN